MAVAPEVLFGLSSLDEDTRRFALGVLLSERDLRALPDLRRVESSDDSDELRLIARRAILNQAGALQSGPEKKSGVPPLDDPDPERRILAIGARAVRARPEDVERLVGRLEVEQDPTVRADLTLALGAAGGKGTMLHLEKLLDDPVSDVRACALEAMGLLRDPAAYAFFVRFARDLDNRMRTYSLRALARLGRTNVLRLCQAMCKSPKEWMVFSAVHLLAGLKDPTYGSLFEELLKHPSSDVRAKAHEGIEQLSEIGDEAAIAILKKIRPEVSASGTFKVHLRSRKIPLPDLGTEGLSDPDPAVRLKHIQLIENRKDLTAVPSLTLRLTLETDMRVLATLVAVVGRMGDPAAVEELETLLESPNDRVRANAVESIGQLVPLEERRRVLRCLCDTHHRVRGNAIVALWGSSYGGVRDSLLGLATNADKKSRLAAIYTIGQIGEPASSLLHTLLVDPDPEVAQRARECQQKIGLIDTAEPGSTTPAPPSSQAMAEPRPQTADLLREWIAKREEARTAVLRELADGYRERVGKELTAPSDICPLLGDVTQCYQKLRRDRPETKSAYHQKLEMLGRAIKDGTLWTDGPAAPLLTRLETLDGELDSAKKELAKFEPAKRTVPKWAVALALLAIVAAVTCYFLVLHTPPLE